MRVIYFLLLATLLASCGKDNDQGGLQTTINLTVVNAFTDARLGNQRFEFIDCKGGFLSSINGCTRTNTLNSNNLGTATFQFVNEEDRYYELQYRPNSNWLDFEYMSPTLARIKEGEVNNIRFELKPTAQLGIHFQYEPSPDYESLSYNVTRETSGERYPDFLGFQGTGFSELSNPIDTIIYRPVMQDESYTIDIIIEKQDGGRERIINTIEIPKEDTFIHELNF